ncbi:hypothetical protein QQS21_009880 [Conoideocrella luteorostrata]|uniref:C2H2-type domain-containing protein n=1 Tax=Conoideocrella luteorostrata TaxID=1105319 RepID=A0AAJ0CIG3_9HYPO|nr:hypothetical protein QQS21_009880 [Conoideocrella luteorostrata]
MDSSKRSSFDERSTTASALRLFTRTPTGHRLSLRRSGTTSTSSASVRSFQTEKPTSCVTRETLNDDCALHRFIVWAAVKRNDCIKMTPEERRECPLLRCRKRFPNHELMLQHLYSCEHLESGEYWCYDCERAEKLHDEIKCRRCLGHPSKRKRLMSMAKSVFSSLGRPKSANLPVIEMDMEDDPPSYSSLLQTNENQQFELQSNEIHEIDSGEVLLASIPEHAEVSRSSSTSTNYTGSISIRSRQAPVDTRAPFDESLINWEPSPQISTISPAQLERHDAENNDAKPSLHIDTAMLDFFRSRSTHRSKTLAPSNSVRSTTSTTSTNSTSSTASCTISPMSAWSGAWRNPQIFNSTLTSPADDVPKPEDALPSAQTLPVHPEIDDTDMDFAHFWDGSGSLDGLIELPADVPMCVGPVDLNTSVVPHSAGDFTLYNAETPLQNSLTAATRALPKLVEDPTYGSLRPSAHTIIQSAQDTLELHIAESMAKLDGLVRDGKTPLAMNFHSMLPGSIAAVGLEALSDILQGKHLTSSLKLLCYVHVIYSFSLVVHEQSEAQWWTELFTQSLAYSSWLPNEDRLAYIQVVDFLWKPGDMTDEVFMDLLQRNLAPLSSQSSSWKGKAPAQFIDTDRDLLIFIAEYFLDELEFAALQDTTRPEIQASSLCIQHLKDVNLAMSPNSPFTFAAKYLILLLERKYQAAPGYLRSLSDLTTKIDSNHVSTVRRLELELMQRGKMQLPTDSNLDAYVEQIRAEINSLITNGCLVVPPRLLYQRLGIELTASVMQGRRINPSYSDNLSSIAPGHATVVKEGKPNDTADGFTFAGWPGLDITNMLTPPVPEVPTPSSQQQQQSLCPPAAASTSRHPSVDIEKPSSPGRVHAESMSNDKVEGDMCCDICGYRPKGDPKWFHGSMAKHKKLQHSINPPKVYACPFPGCNSRYQKRADNLRQHQIEKGHFVNRQDGSARSRKRKKTE